MTTSDLTVYGRPLHSLWDRRIGGRYELTEITGNGGLGMWVTLQRVDGGHELAMSVHNLGLNYVCVPAVPEHPAHDCSTCTACLHDGHKCCGCYDGACCQPAEALIGCAGCGRLDGLNVNGWCEACAPFRPDLPPDDVPLAAWEIEHLGREADVIGGIRFGDLIILSGVPYRVVDADGKAILEPEPAPTPPLPWVEHPDAWWVYVPNGERMSATVHSSAMIAPTPADWHRAAVIPWGLIDQLRVVVPGDDDNGLNEAADAILDAADEVTS